MGNWFCSGLGHKQSRSGLQIRHWQAFTDDMPDRRPRPGSDLTQEQISEVIWGPYRLSLGVQDTSRNGRVRGPFRLPKHEPYPLQLEQTMAPSWATLGHPPFLA